MDITIKGASSVPEGVYKGQFAGIEAKTSQKDNSPYWRWVFQVETPEGEKVVSGVSSTNSGPKSKSYKWLGAILGRKPSADERIRTPDLVGSPCVVTVEENDDGFSNVVDVRAGRLSDTTIQSYADEADFGPEDQFQP